MAYNTNLILEMGIVSDWFLASGNSRPWCGRVPMFLAHSEVAIWMLNS